jgi:drug/metabolite transporter (DMT)-like permease
LYESHDDDDDVQHIKYVFATSYSYIYHHMYIKYSIVVSCRVSLSWIVIRVYCKALSVSSSLFLLFFFLLFAMSFNISFTRVKLFLVDFHFFFALFRVLISYIYMCCFYYSIRSSTSFTVARSHRRRVLIDSL